MTSDRPRTIDLTHARNVCARKYRYTSRKDAEALLLDKVKVDPDYASNNVYRCDYCRGYHIGRPRSRRDA